MKKNYFITTFVTFVAMLTLACSLCSCEDQQFIEQASTVSNSQLISDLHEVNENILANQVITRGMSTGDKVKIVAADVRGAMRGGQKGWSLGRKIGTAVGHPVAGMAIGTICGAVGYGGIKSWIAYSKVEKAGNYEKAELAQVVRVCKTNIPDTIKTLDVSFKTTTDSIVNKKINVNDSILSTVNLSRSELIVGKMHNVALSYLDGSVKFEGSDSINTQNPMVCKIMDSDEMKELLESALNENDDDEDDALTSYVINLFEEVLAKYAQNCNDIAFIINQYMEVINASEELTDEQKSCIRNSLATALYSFNYWEKTLE